MKRVAFLALALVAQAALAQNAGLAHAAVAQVGVTRHYDPSYVRLRYPGGDVSQDRGVCSDVVIRAFRAVGVDLQVAVHEDMRANFAAYPTNWSLGRPDRNIDHRRVPNLMRFFVRRGRAIAIGAPYEPGDIVAWQLTGGLYHIGVVSDVRNATGTEQLVVHNIGHGTKNEDVLRSFKILGHYRW